MPSLTTTEALRLCAATSDIDTIVSLSRHEDPRVRQRALKEMCPCQVRGDIAEFWRRVIELAGDPEASVRLQVCHTLCDGSPGHMEEEVEAALRLFIKDADSRVRRLATRALGAYRRTGRWNVL
jgi:hypothetical protein